MLERHFKNLNEGYIGILVDLITQGTLVYSVNDPLSVGSSFGKKVRETKEIIGYSFAIDSPIHRLLHLKSRKINLPYAIANALWTMTGSDSLEFIAFYNSRGLLFSDNQTTLHGAHGKRLLRAEDINQITAIIHRLKIDPYSRRAVAVIYWPIDSIAASRDIPCPIAIQFLQRNGKLHAICFMRSQSAAMVLPYDIFIFTFIQEAIAVELNLELGIYYHTCGSFHYYMDEEALIQEIVKEGEAAFSADDVSAPYMPREVSPFEMIEALLILEHEMRLHMKGSELKFDSSRMLLLPEYWKNLALALAAGIAVHYNRDNTYYVSLLPTCYARYFT